MASSTLSSEKRPHKGSLKNAGQCYAPDCWCNRVALTSNERLGVIKQTPRQASIDDIEWLCEEVERLRGEAEVADEQLAQLRGFAEAHKTCRGSDETCEQQPVAWRRYVDDPYEIRPRWLLTSVRPLVDASKWEPLYAPPTLKASEERS